MAQQRRRRGWRTLNRKAGSVFHAVYGQEWSNVMEPFDYYATPSVFAVVPWSTLLLHYPRYRS